MTRFALMLTVLLAALNSLAEAPEPFDGTLLHPQSTADVVLVKSAEGVVKPVRLFGVACPVAGQPQAEAAVAFYKTLGKEVAVTVEPLVVDNGGLTVARVRLGKGPTLGERLLAAGLAWWDEPNAPKANKLKKLSAKALVAGTGLWKDSTPLAPWDYRAGHGMAPVKYTVKAEAVAEKAEEAPKEETPTLAAKGEAKPRPAMPAGVAPEDYLSLAAKHQPHIARDGQGNPLGLTASDIAGIPGASQVGFQNGDIVRSVNGIQLTSEAQMFGLVGQLQGAKELRLEVIRNGKPVTLRIPL